MRTPPPPSPFPDCNIRIVQKGMSFHRVHDGRFGSCSFNPGLGRPSRFAPLLLTSGPIPTQYLATTFECAVAETIFHDVPLDEPNKTVGVDNIKPLVHSVVATTRDLNLVPLFTPDLAKWNITRGQLIDTAASEYDVTAQWALAIHQSRADVDGLIWTSKRCDPHQALILFGDRVAETDLTAASKSSIYSNIVAMEQVIAFAKRTEIDLVM